MTGQIWTPTLRREIERQLARLKLEGVEWELVGDETQPQKKSFASRLPFHFEYLHCVICGRLSLQEKIIFLLHAFKGGI